MVKKSTTLFKLILLLIIMLAVFMPSVFAANELTNSINNYTSEMFKQRAKTSMVNRIGTASASTYGFNVSTLGYGSTVTLSSYFDNGAFCVDHGEHYASGTYYVYDKGLISQIGGIDPLEFSFAMGEYLRAANTNNQITIGGGRHIDAHDNPNTGSSSRGAGPWGNYVWAEAVSAGIGHFGITSSGQASVDPSTFSGMLNKYAAYQAIYNQVVGTGTNPLNITPVRPDGTDIITTLGISSDPNEKKLESDQVLTANANNLLKLKIEYPWKDVLNEYYDGIDASSIPHLLDIVNVKIKLSNTSNSDVILYDSTLVDPSNPNDPNNLLKDSSGNPFTVDDTQAQQEVYIPVDLVSYGEYNDIKVEWDFIYYDTASYALVTPKRTLVYKVNPTSSCDWGTYEDEGTFLVSGWNQQGEQDLKNGWTNLQILTAPDPDENGCEGYVPVNGYNLSQTVHVLDDGTAHIHTNALYKKIRTRWSEFL